MLQTARQGLTCGGLGVLCSEDGEMVMRVALPSGGNLIVWKRAIPRNRMRETFTSGSVGGLVGNTRFYPDSRRATRMIIPQLPKMEKCSIVPAVTVSLARG